MLSGRFGKYRRAKIDRVRKMERQKRKFVEFERFMQPIKVSNPKEEGEG